MSASLPPTASVGSPAACPLNPSNLATYLPPTPQGDAAQVDAPPLEPSVNTTSVPDSRAATSRSLSRTHRRASAPTPHDLFSALEAAVVVRDAARRAHSTAWLADDAAASSMLAAHTHFTATPDTAPIAHHAAATALLAAHAFAQVAAAQLTTADAHLDTALAAYSAAAAAVDELYRDRGYDASSPTLPTQPSQPI